MYTRFMVALVCKRQALPQQETIIFFYLTAQGPAAGYRKQEDTLRKALLVNRWSAVAVLAPFITTHKNY